MKCHVCLREMEQTHYKGSSYCIRCLWEAFPKLKENNIDKAKESKNAKEKAK